ncbi:Na+/H+ antiporter subunit E [Pleionea sediminis]|uniref:Na+/H+ antiporter subunit E n=1 Tax=Pleionea sediminis TaxID=2569479 RepID=UPI001185558D|nr:Na+/H+ antiporter subunit E [Pleionea sediminis]
MRHTISITLVLSILWIVNSGYYTPLLLSFGLISVLFVVWIAHRMDVVDHETLPIHLSGKLLAYYFWLMKKIIISNIDVARRVWQINPDLSPKLKKLAITQKTDMGRVIYANSINLTPGTLSVDLKNDYVLVHSLTSDGIKELEQGEMDRLVTELE